MSTVDSQCQNYHGLSTIDNGLHLFATFIFMTAIDLVYGMHNYFLLLSSLEETEQTYLKTKGQPAATFHKAVSLAYDTITLTLDVVTAKGGKPETSLYLECTFDIRNQNVTSGRVYCENKEREPHIKNFVQRQTPKRFPAAASTSPYQPETLRYISIADTIAKEAYLYSSGDHYRPGHFSEMIIDDEIITLRQINRHNSKSIAHKDDYLMRDLEFFIPLKSATPKPSFQDEHIGNMVIRFSDTSSKKNKQGGNQIREKIDEEKLRFENLNK